MHFTDERHAERYFQTLNDYGISQKDNRRKALMYCLCSQETIYSRMDRAYSKESQGIVLHKTSPGDDMINYTVDPCFSAFEKIFVMLGFNFFDGFIDANVNPHAFYLESPSMRRLYYQAIEIFFADKTTLVVY